MNREVSREKKLSAFELSMGDLELLLNRLCALFALPDEVRLNIDIDLKSEQLGFATFAEFRDFNDLPSRCVDFKIYLSQDGRRISLRSHSFFGAGGRILATADNEAWCAGVVETVSSFIRSRRVWYWWLISAPLGLLLVAYSSFSVSFFLSSEGGKQIESKFFIAWLGIFLLLIVLNLAKDKSLPPCSIQRVDEIGFVRNHISELGLVIAAISAIISLAGIFVK